MPFQPSVGIQTSKRMSESLVGRIEPATRQAVVTIAGLNVPAGTTVAVVIVVSGRCRPARLSQDLGPVAYAGAEIVVSVSTTTNFFMMALPSIVIVVIIVVVLAVMLLRLARGQDRSRR